MRSFWTEPFLWIHLAGLAAVPLALEVVWLGLAVGDPILPVWMEYLLLAIVGIAPVLLMQLTRPFDIFSILVLALKPEQLTLEQRRILSLFKTKTNSLVNIFAAVFMLWVLWQIYKVAPVVAPVASFLPQWRIVGLLLAGVAFLGSNLFLQIPLNVLQVLLASESEFQSAEAYPVEKMRQDFTIPGFKVNKILPISIASTGSVSAPEPSLKPEQLP